MRWKIEQFVFCEKQQSLLNEGGRQQLEPMVVELLAYFCRNPNKTISRDQLIEHVWAGRIITDNAVTKVITKLRKYFDDDPKAPRFIATFPKKGYRFIATAYEIRDDIAGSATVHSGVQNSSIEQNMGNDRQQTQQPEHKQSVLERLATPPVIVLSLFVAVTVIFVSRVLLVSNSTSNNLQPIFTQVKAVTRDPGRESRPQISPDGKYLAYVEVRDRKMRLWIKSLEDETAIEVNHGEATNVWVDSLSWNSDGSQFVYLVTTPESCRYFIRDFDQLSLGEPELIHNCPVGSYGKIAFTHDDNRVVYSEASKRRAPFELFELNLSSSKKRRVNQPELFLGGNSQFDVHPTQNRLLISSPDEQQWEGFYSLDLETDELELLFKQDAFICCGRWDHTGERVILMGEHPATELVSFDLKGKDAQVIYSGSEQVRVPERHVNGQDYLFPIVQVNQNAYFYSFETQQSTAIANSSVDDSLAVLAHHDDQVAYISLSSGEEEIWLTNYEGSWRKKLTNFEAGLHYLELGWSHDGKNIFGLTFNKIHVIDTTTGKKKVLKIPQVEIRGVSWKDNETISYSIKTVNGWQVHYYNLETNDVVVNNEGWQYVSYASNPDDTLWLNSDNKLLVGSERLHILDSDIDSKYLVDGRQFNLKKREKLWAWSQFNKGRHQLSLKNGLDNKAELLLMSDSYHFDLTKKGVVFHRMESVKSDIYQTASD
ncbi:hypothetical protein FLL45_04555 [Aliikangiella marina]|uniref:OmpR/PhoB-type domain-containing protein n=1 Tax=Aliikangiella marina TaxID=1712262 RepID=A0A545TJ16_9GAMM|nr:winged helix-turn-helix domain-containing protein [Aliikangiella marina]TQV77222.1 hypothetical protein FLL45_04555 [Aliikangiella marina]